MLDVDQGRKSFLVILFTPHTRKMILESETLIFFWIRTKIIVSHILQEIQWNGTWLEESIEQLWPGQWWQIQRGLEKELHWSWTHSGHSPAGSLSNPDFPRYWLIISGGIWTPKNPTWTVRTISCICLNVLALLWSTSSSTSSTSISTTASEFSLPLVRVRRTMFLRKTKLLQVRCIQTWHLM